MVDPENLLIYTKCFMNSLPLITFVPLLNSEEKKKLLSYKNSSTLSRFPISFFTYLFNPSSSYSRFAFFTSNLPKNFRYVRVIEVFIITGLKYQNSIFLQYFLNIVLLKQEIKKKHQDFSCKFDIWRFLLECYHLWKFQY